MGKETQKLNSRLPFRDIAETAHTEGFGYKQAVEKLTHRTAKKQSDDKNEQLSEENFRNALMSI